MRTFPSLSTLQKCCSSAGVQPTQLWLRSCVRVTSGIEVTCHPRRAGAQAPASLVLSHSMTTSSPAASVAGPEPAASAPAASSSGGPLGPQLGPPYDQVIRSDFLSPGPLPDDQRVYLVVLNYRLPAGLLHVWSLATFRLCADGGCNRLHDELPGMLPPLLPEGTTPVGPAAAPKAAGDGTVGQVLSASPSRCGSGTAASASSPGQLADGSRDGPIQYGNGNSHPDGPHLQHSDLPPTCGRSGVGNDSAATETAAGPGTFPVDTATALRFSHVPDVVIGDLDSLRPDIRDYYVGHGVPFLDLSYDQDTNDLAKAVNLIEERFISRDPEAQRDRHQILVLGALGGRLDHTLANLNVLHMYPHLNIALWGDGNLVRLVRPGTALIRPDERFEGPTCGLIPIAGPVTASSTGLYWNLADTAMRVGGLVSSSNLLTGTQVEVACDGPLLWSTEVRSDPRPDMQQLWAVMAAGAADAARRQQQQGAAVAAREGVASALEVDVAGNGAATPV